MTIIPTAEVIAHRKTYCRIRCPYCHDIHVHKSSPGGGGKFTAGTTHHRAPGCGLHLNQNQRLTGYKFTITQEES